MNTNIHAPNIGEDELEVTEILVQIGNKININQPIVVIEGDKASMEIPSPHSGVITEIFVNVGDKIHTGSLIMSINQNISNIKNQTLEHQNDIIQNVSNIKSIKNLENQPQDFPANKNYTIHATPLIRRLSREFNIDLSKIKGSGRKGRILREDIQNYINLEKINTNTDYQKKETSKKNICDNTSTWPEIDFTKFGEIKITKLNKIQKISGANLQRNWIKIPHVTQFDETDITDLETFRKQQNNEINKKNLNFKITILAFVIKAVSKALEMFPKFNSSLLKDEQTLILKKYINIGIAVDTPNGLLVPVINATNKKGIYEIAKSIKKIAKKVHSKNPLHPSEIQGGCFTISSLGNIGGMSFTPIINAPEVAILGISKSVTKPIWNGKKFIPRTMLPLSLSYDHRVINGADGVRFIKLINQIISDIRMLSM